MKLFEYLFVGRVRRKDIELDHLDILLTPERRCKLYTYVPGTKLHINNLYVLLFDFSFIYRDVSMDLAVILLRDFNILVLHTIPCINLGS